MRLYEKENVAEAQRIAATLARGDWVAIQGGFIAVKVGLERFYDHTNPPRLPCVMPEKSAREEIEVGFAEIMELETNLEV
jgi:hypothetical protein